MMSNLATAFEIAMEKARRLAEQAAPPPVAEYSPPPAEPAYSEASASAWAPPPEPWQAPAFSPYEPTPDFQQPMQPEAVAATDFYQGDWAPYAQDVALPGPSVMPDFLAAEQTPRVGDVPAASGYSANGLLGHAADTPLERLGQGLARAPQELASALSFGLIEPPEPMYNIPIAGGPVGGDARTGGFGGPPLAQSIADIAGSEVPAGPLGLVGFGANMLTDPYNFVGGPKPKPTQAISRAVPESADDLERLMMESMSRLKKNPDAAKAAFGAEAQKVGQQIDEAQQAASGFYRDTGHVAKRATKLSEAMDNLKGGGTRSGIIADTLPRDTREAVLKSVGAAGLGGTIAGVGGELDSNPDTTFAGEFGKGALAGLASQAGIRTRVNAAEDPNDQYGFRGAFGSARNAVTDSFADQAYARVARGERLPMSERVGTVENKIQSAADAGAIQSRDDVINIVNQHYGQPPATTTMPPGFGVPAAPKASIRPNTNTVEDAEELRRAAPPSPFKTFVDNVLSIPNASKRIQASGDIAGAQGRQNLPSLFIDPKVWGTNTKRAVRAFFEDPDARGVMDEVAKLPRFGYNDPALRLSVGGKEIAVPPMVKVLGFGDDFAAPGYEKAKDTALMRFVERNQPLGIRSQKAQEAAIVGTATDLRNQMIDSALKASVTDPTWYAHYGDIAKVATGYGDVPRALKGMSQGFYSLRNVAARLQTLTQPITKPGPLFAIQDKAAKTQGIFSASPRGVAARHAVRFGVGELANLRLLAAAGEASGLFDVGYDPLGSGFGRLTMTDDKGNDTSLDLLGGYGSLIKTLARSAAAAKDIQEGKEPRYDIPVEWLQFMRYKMAGMPAALVDTAIANSELSKVEGLQSPFAFDLLDKDSWTSGKWMEWGIPFFAGDAVQQLISGDFDTSADGLFKSGLLLTGQFAGLPVSTFPATARDDADRLSRQAIGKGETYTNAAGEVVPYPTTYIDEKGQPQQVTTLAELKAADPLAAEDLLKKNPDASGALDADKSTTSKRIAELHAEFNERQSRRDVTLLPTDGETWRKESAADNARVQAMIEERARDFGTYEKEPTSLLDLANLKYHNAIEASTVDGVVDWDKVDRETSKLSPQEQDLLFANRLAGDTDARKQYIRDLVKLEPFFESRDEAWARLQQANPEFAQYKDLDAYRLAKVLEVMQKNPGYPRPVVEDLIDKSLGVLTQSASLAGAQYLVQNRELVPLLAKYGFSVPALVAPLAGQPVAGGVGR